MNCVSRLHGAASVCCGHAGDVSQCSARERISASERSRDGRGTEDRRQTTRGASKSFGRGGRSDGASALISDQFFLSFCLFVCSLCRSPPSPRCLAMNGEQCTVVRRPLRWIAAMRLQRGSATQRIGDSFGCCPIHSLPASARGEQAAAVAMRTASTRSIDGWDATSVPRACIVQCSPLALIRRRGALRSPPGQVSSCEAGLCMWTEPSDAASCCSMRSGSAG